MRILLFDHPTMGQHILNALRELGHEVQLLENVDAISPADIAGLFQQWQPERLICVRADPLAMGLADMFQVACVVWIVDYPDHMVFSEAARSPHVHLFHFDSVMAGSLEESLHKLVCHLPPGADLAQYPQVTEPQLQRFSTDIAFVGNMESDKEAFDNPVWRAWLGPERLASLEAAFDAMLADFESCALNEEIDATWLADARLRAKELPSVPWMSQRDLCFEHLLRHFSVLERQHIIQCVAKHRGLRVYGQQEWQRLGFEGLEWAGQIDSNTEMPAAFHCARINLNITKRQVPAGLPKRVFDVLASGGFLLSNPQSELTDYFEDGKHLVIYHSTAELLELIDYYLEHGEQRQAIAKAGHELVTKQHSYPQRVQEALKMVSLGGLA